MGFMATSLSNTVGLDFSRPVWKRLVGEDLAPGDLGTLDGGILSKIKFLSSAEVMGYDEDNLDMVLNGQRMIETVSALSRA